MKPNQLWWIAGIQYDGSIILTSFEMISWTYYEFGEYIFQRCRDTGLGIQMEVVWRSSSREEERRHIPMRAPYWQDMATAS